MTYDVLGPGPLDYLPCRYGTSRLLFRGPRRSLEAPYIAFIGATETYGKFIASPFPDLVEKGLGTTCVNFGQLNAGVDAFMHDPFVLEAASNAEVAVIQVVGAQNMTNRFYTVHPRRNDRFVAASTLLKTIFREVDFADFHFNKHMLSALYQNAPDRFDAVRTELQEAWKARMRLMLKQISGKTVLLWMSDRAPENGGTLGEGGIGAEPLFVTRDMLNDVAAHATAVVEVVGSPEARKAGTDGMLFSEMDAVAAAEMLNPMVHQEAADALIRKIGAML